MRLRTLFERLPDREAEIACGLRMEVGLGGGGTLSKALQQHPWEENHSTSRHSTVLRWTCAETGKVCCGA